jgi:hypothetical protein
MARLGAVRFYAFMSLFTFRAEFSYRGDRLAKLNLARWRNGYYAWDGAPSHTLARFQAGPP